MEISHAATSKSNTFRLGEAQKLKMLLERLNIAAE